MYTTVYPTDIANRTNLPVWVDNVDDVEAKTVNDPVTELIAVQKELGTIPSGSAASLTARLTVSINDDGSLKSTLTPTFAGLSLTGSLLVSGTTPPDITLDNTTVSADGNSGFFILQGNKWFVGFNNDIKAGIKLYNGSNPNNHWIGFAYNAAGAAKTRFYTNTGDIETDGYLKVGNSPTNYCEIKNDGEINLHGTGRVTRHLYASPSAFKLPAAHFPSVGITGVHNTLDFDAGATNESAYCSNKVPYRWDSTTDLTIEISWFYSGTQDDGFVVWGVEYKGIKAGDAVAGAGTTATQKSTGTHTTGQIVRTSFSTKLLAANLESDDDLGLRIFRNSSDGTNDTLAVDAKLISVHLYFTMDKLGKAT